MSQYSINPVSRGLNNFFESITNSTNPTYIQPIQQTSYTPQQQPTYTPYHSQTTFSSTQYTPIVSQPLPTVTYPTVTYTPELLRSSFIPLNSNYNSSYYGTR